jgi:hypothetical protein
MKYRKKPVVIEAMRLGAYTLGLKGGEVWQWMTDGGAVFTMDQMDPGPAFMRIGTLEGEMTAQIGDWIIKGVQGEFYPCKPDIFDATYEAL